MALRPKYLTVQQQAEILEVVQYPQYKPQSSANESASPAQPETQCADPTLILQEPKHHKYTVHKSDTVICYDQTKDQNNYLTFRKYFVD